MYHPRQVPEIFLQFLFGHRSVQEVEKFVYEHNNLKEVVGYAWEDEFLSFNFHAAESVVQLRSLLHQFIQDTPMIAEIENVIWKSDTVYISKQLIRGDIELHVGARRLWSEWFMRNRQPWEDVDFAAFGAVDAAIEDYYEYGEKGQQDSNEAIIRTVSERYRSEIMQASRNIIRRFDFYYSSPSGE